MMTWPPVRVTAPEATPVTLADAKAHLRVDHADDDALITMLIDVATQYLDGYGGALGKAIISQTWEQDASAWCGVLALALQVGPLQSVTTLSIVGDDGATVETIDLAGYRVDLGYGLLVPRRDTVLPALDDGQRLIVRYVAGYGDAPADVPAPIRHAILLLVGAWYENREQAAPGANVNELPAGVSVHALLAPIRGILL